MIDTKNIVQNLGLDNLTAAEQIQFLDEIQKTIKESKAQRNETIKSNITVVIKALKKIEEDIKSRYDEVGKQISDRVASIKDGKDGRDGRNGRDGKDGLPGRDGVDGKDGLNGRDGKDGQDGISVTNASIDFDGSLVFYLSDGTEVNVGEIVPVDIAEKIKVINTMSTNAAVEIKDEGNVITSGVTSINFTGSGVTATASGDAVTVNVTGGGGGGGDVTGPASSTDNAIVRFDGTTGKLVQNSVVTIADTTGNIAGVGTLTTSGNVGIGMTGPGARLDITSAIAFTARFSGPANTFIDVTDGTGTFRAQVIAGEPTLSAVGAYPIKFITNSSERMRLDSSGNLAIGTAAPANRLDIVNSASGAQMTIAGSDGLYAGMFGGTGSVGPGIFFLDTAPALRFGTGTAKSLGTFTELMRLTSGGSLGLGIASPAYRLDVNAGVADFAARILNGGVSFSRQGLLLQGGNNTEFYGLSTRTADASCEFGFRIQAGSLPAVWSTTNHSIIFGNNNTERMRLDTSGNLGIGLTTVAQKLDVIGSGQFRPAATQDAVLISGRAGGTSSYAATITPTTLTDNRTITLPDATTTVVGTDATQTITNKRVNPRAVAAGATSGNLTPNGDTTDVFNAFGLTGAITMLTPSGTPVDGQRLMLRFEDNGTGRGITWTTSSGAFRAVGVTLPTTTVASKITYVGCVYNSTDVFWDVVATVTQA